MNVSDNMTLQATLEKSEVSSTSKLRNQFEWPGRACLLVALLISPWLFGSVYFSAKFLIAVCLLVGIAFLWFESSVSERKSLVLPYLLLPMTIGILIVILQMVPLSDGLGWLLGRQKELYPFLSGIDNPRITISMSREGTWDQLGLLIMAFCATTLGSRYFRSAEQIKILLATVTFNGVLVSLFGIVQSLSTQGTGTIYWTVKLLEGGTPFGPYVNRNNAAGYLLICLGCSLGLLTIVFAKSRKGPKPMGTKDLPFWAQFNNHFLRFIAELNATKIACGMASVVISAAIIASLSRGGVLAMLAGLVITLLFYGMARRPSFSAFIAIPAFAFSICFAGWLGFGDQIRNRFEKVNTVDVADQSDNRLKHWKETWPAVQEFGIFGSGVGAYGEVHRLYRIDNETSIYEYAESQFFQTLVELGWPGLVCLLAAWFLMAYYSTFLLWQGSSASSIAVGVAGVFTTASVFIASIFDFGLYLPANMLLMSLFSGFVAFHAHSLATRLKKKNWLRFETYNTLAQILLLVLFASLAMYSLDFYRKWQIESAVREYPYRTFAVDNPTLDETSRLIDKISPLVETTQNHEGLDYMARLYIHRSRLQLYRDLESVLADDLAKKQRWERTALDMVHENAWSLREGGMLFSATKFLRREFIVDNLPWARKYLMASQKIAPMEPGTHIRLAQINALIGTSKSATEDIERAIMVAPTKTGLRLLAALYYLQSRNGDAAVKQLHELLTIDRRQFKNAMKLVFGGSNRNVARIDEIRVVNEIMPDDPRLLFSLATKYLLPDTQSKIAALDRADQLLVDISAADSQRIKLKADIKMEKKEYSEALEQYEYLLDSNPADYETHFKLANLLMRLEDFKGAKSKLDYISTMGGLPKRQKEIQDLRETAARKIREELNFK